MVFIYAYSKRCAQLTAFFPFLHLVLLQIQQSVSLCRLQLSILGLLGPMGQSLNSSVDVVSVAGREMLYRKRYNNKEPVVWNRLLGGV
jgi:hypothetical protein